MPRPARFLAAALASTLLLAGCDAAAPGPAADSATDASDDALALVVSITEGDRLLRTDCGGGDAAVLARAHVAPADQGHSLLVLDLALLSRADELREECRVHIVFPFRTDRLLPGTYEVGASDRAYLLYEREARGVTETFRFAVTSGTLRLDRVGADALAGHLGVRAVSDRGTATALADFRAPLAR
jgi:hypothetical protein